MLSPKKESTHRSSRLSSAFDFRSFPLFSLGLRRILLFGGDELSIFCAISFEERTSEHREEEGPELVIEKMYEFGGDSGRVT